jgi:hypothetical protein
MNTDLPLRRETRGEDRCRDTSVEPLAAYPDLGIAVQGSVTILAWIY